MTGEEPKTTEADGTDPQWVTVNDDTGIEVWMTPGHAAAYQRWLRDNNLHLFKIPGTETYGVGVRHFLEGDDA